jgi:hypothetical protein
MVHVSNGPRQTIYTLCHVSSIRHEQLIVKAHEHTLNKL